MIGDRRVNGERGDARCEESGGKREAQCYNNIIMMMMNVECRVMVTHVLTCLISFGGKVVTH